MKVWIVTSQTEYDSTMEGVYANAEVALAAHPAPKGCWWTQDTDAGLRLNGLSPKNGNWTITPHEVLDRTRLQPAEPLPHTEDMTPGSSISRVSSETTAVVGENPTLGSKL